MENASSLRIVKCTGGDCFSKCVALFNCILFRHECLGDLTALSVKLVRGIRGYLSIPHRVGEICELHSHRKHLLINWETRPDWQLSKRLSMVKIDHPLTIVAARLVGWDDCLFVCLILLMWLSRCWGPAHLILSLSSSFRGERNLQAARVIPCP